MMSEMLPKFERPPVVEALIGAEFEDLIAWQVPHYGLFWQEIRQEFPRYAVQPPLNSAIEKFDFASQQEITIPLFESVPPRVRCWFFDTSGEFLVQVQPDRLLFNWRKQVGAENYPRFAQLEGRFREVWQKFITFIDGESLGQIKLTQCEMTYFNQVPIEYGNPLKDVVSQECAFLPAPETSSTQRSYRIADDRGRLRVAVQPIYRHTDAKLFTQMTVTARVLPKSPALADLPEALTLAHKWAVCGFADLTAPSLHERWERKQ